MALVRPYPNYPAFRRKLGIMPDFSGSKLAYNEIPMGDIDGNNRIFRLAYQPLSKSLQVFKDGMYMHKGVDYVLNRQEQTITFSEHQIPQEGSVILVNYKHY